MAAAAGAFMSYQSMRAGDGGGSNVPEGEGVLAAMGDALVRLVKLVGGESSADDGDDDGAADDGE